MTRTVTLLLATLLAVGAGTSAVLATVFGLESLADWGPQAAIGIGGVERWIAYPVLLWLVLLGAAFMTRGTQRIDE